MNTSPFVLFPSSREGDLFLRYEAAMTASAQYCLDSIDYAIMHQAFSMSFLLVRSAIPCFSEVYGAEVYAKYTPTSNISWASHYNNAYCCQYTMNAHDHTLD